MYLDPIDDPEVLRAIKEEDEEMTTAANASGGGGNGGGVSGGSGSDSLMPSNLGLTRMQELSAVPDVVLISGLGGSDSGRRSGSGDINSSSGGRNRIGRSGTGAGAKDRTNQASDWEIAIAAQLDALCPPLSSTPRLQDKAIRAVLSIGVDVVVVDADCSAAMGPLGLLPADLLTSDDTDSLFGYFMIPAMPPAAVEADTPARTGRRASGTSSTTTTTTSMRKGYRGR